MGLSLESALIIASWFEALVYGILLCLFAGSLYINLHLQEVQDGHSKVMFYAGIIMFIIATLHLANNCYRLVQAYVVHAQNPAMYLQVLGSWHQVLKNALFVTQQILGDGVATYRAWIIWQYDWRPIFIPAILWIASVVSGYTTCVLFGKEPATTTLFTTPVQKWILAFSAISLIQSGITTYVMAYRIWKMNNQTQTYGRRRGHFFPILRILVESASLQFFSGFLLVTLYSFNVSAQYILLESFPVLLAIAFNAITIRIALYSKDKEDPETLCLTTFFVDPGDIPYQDNN